MLFRGDEEIEIPGAGLEILRQVFASQSRIDGMRISDRLAVAFDDAADGVRRGEREVHFRFRGGKRRPPLLDVRTRQPAPDHVEVGARRRTQTGVWRLAGQCRKWRIPVNTM